MARVFPIYLNSTINPLSLGISQYGACIISNLRLCRNRKPKECPYSDVFGSAILSC